MLENSKFRNYDVNYVIITYLLLARAFTNAKSHECTLENLDYYSTSVPRVRRTNNLRLAVVMLSTLLDKLRALSAQSALEYGPAHLRASEFRENLRIIGGGVQNNSWEG